jgi:hypothetical protein
MNHSTWSRSLEHVAYAGAWKRLGPVWDWVIRRKRLLYSRPLLESVLATVRPHSRVATGMLDRLEEARAG